MNPFPYFSRERWIAIVPALLTLLLIWLQAAPSVLTQGITPLWFFLCVILFTIHTPRQMPAIVIVLLSLIDDTVMDTPLGLSGSVGLILAIALGRGQRVIARQSTAFIWLLVMAVLLIASGLSILLSQSFGLAIDMRAALLAFLYTLPLVPLMQPIAAWLGRQM
jgi:cell shape-determining protein MreD